MRRLGLAGLGLVLLAAGCGTAYDPNNASEAQAQCQGFAEQKLKAPATADFHLTAQQSGAQWVVTGTVDAENSYGAKIRNDVHCVLHFQGQTAYLDDISVG